ncbi:DUF4339 domain-containing protein [Planctomicrobium sp. SH668]|uniref:DUF4339 domain-containing protein n=1 Tax=Planctomicrobium sp. SH668 TaxID=3448126 RepID=UPI003F5AEB31
MATRWFFMQDGSPQGPITASVLKTLVQSGVITGESLVRPETSTRFVPARQIKGLITPVTPPAAGIHSPPNTAPASQPVETTPTEACPRRRGLGRIFDFRLLATVVLAAILVWIPLGAWVYWMNPQLMSAFLPGAPEAAEQQVAAVPEVVAPENDEDPILEPQPEAPVVPVAVPEVMAETKPPMPVPSVDLDFNRFREPRIVRSLHDGNYALLRNQEQRNFTYLKRFVTAFNSQEIVMVVPPEHRVTLREIQDPVLSTKITQYFVRSPRLQTDIVNTQLDGLLGGFMEIADVRRRGGTVMDEVNALVQRSSEPGLEFEEAGASGEADGTMLALLTGQSPDSARQILKGINGFMMSGVGGPNRVRQDLENWNGPQSIQELPPDVLRNLEYDLVGFALLVTEGAHQVLEHRIDRTKLLKSAPSRSSLTLYYGSLRHYMQRFDAESLSKDVRVFGREMEDWAARWEPADGEVPYGPIIAGFFAGDSGGSYLDAFAEYDRMMAFIAQSGVSQDHSPDRREEMARNRARAREYVVAMNRFRPDFVFEVDLKVQPHEVAAMKLPHNILKAGPATIEQLSPELMVEAEVGLTKFAALVVEGGNLLVEMSSSRQQSVTPGQMIAYYQKLEDHLRTFQTPEMSQDVKKFANSLAGWAAEASTSKPNMLAAPILTHFFTGKQPTPFCQQVFSDYDRFMKVISQQSLASSYTAEQATELARLQEDMQTPLKAINKKRSDFVFNLKLGVRVEPPSTGRRSTGRGDQNSPQSSPSGRGRESG